MSRTVSARIPPDLHEELRERCNQIGESINDFVKASIEFALYQATDFDFGDESDEIQSESEHPKILSNLNVELGKVYDEDGNVIGTIGKI